ncbi:MAG: hypothetical protein ACTH31_13225 [Pseudoclavibacter sp.]
MAANIHIGETVTVDGQALPGPIDTFIAVSKTPDDTKLVTVTFPTDDLTIDWESIPEGHSVNFQG